MKETTCLQCGDAGFADGLLYCVKCLHVSVHIYCLPVIPVSLDEDVEWICEDCEAEVQKQHTVSKDNAIQRRSRNDTVSDSSLVCTKRKDVVVSVKTRDPVFECKNESREKRDHGNSPSNCSLRSSNKKRKVISSEANFENQNKRLNSENRGKSETIKATSNYCKEYFKDSNIPSIVDARICVKPIVAPIWRGSFNIRNKKNGDEIDVDGLVAHISNTACQKVHDVASQFQPMLHLEMLHKSDVWPKSFEASTEPSARNIALYFFPSDIRSERDFDHLVSGMMHQELAMRAVFQNFELLVFTSTELPLLNWRFQDKYYLWGVFRQPLWCKKRSII